VRTLVRYDDRGGSRRPRVRRIGELLKITEGKWRGVAAASRRCRGCFQTEYTHRVRRCFAGDAMTKGVLIAGILIGFVSS
jgi:hypothetical protein